jgi:hypothetical protein
MRTTVDIPDPIYRQLKARAATEGPSVKELILRGVQVELGGIATEPHRRIQLPIVPSQKPGTLRLDNAGIYEVIPFP